VLTSFDKYLGKTIRVEEKNESLLLCEYLNMVENIDA